MLTGTNLVGNAMMISCNASVNKGYTQENCCLVELFLVRKESAISVNEVTKYKSQA
jgi:hypothetical protein